MRSKVRGLRAIERRVLEDRRQTAALAPCPSYETPPADDTPPTDLPAVATPEAWAGRDLGGGRTDSALDATGWAVPRCPFRKSCASTFWRRQRIELGHCRIMFDHFSLVIRSSTMPVPLAPPVTLGCDEQSHLASIVRAHSTPQALVFRCRLILRTAAPDRPSNLQVAQELHCNRHTVGRWRSRYLAQGLSGLQDAPRPGRPRRFSPLSASGCDGDGNP